MTENVFLCVLVGSENCFKNISTKPLEPGLLCLVVNSMYRSSTKIVLIMPRGVNILRLIYKQKILNCFFFLPSLSYLMESSITNFLVICCINLLNDYSSLSRGLRWANQVHHGPLVMKNKHDFFYLSLQMLKNLLISHQANILAAQRRMVIIARRGKQRKGTVTRYMAVLE